jgi:glycine/sarcosine N-methyltransferase
MPCSLIGTRPSADQGEIIDRLIRMAISVPAAAIFDGTCGIGTQAIGLALLGHHVTAADLSERAIERAGREALRLGAAVDLRVADVRSLPSALAGRFDAAISFDNALPHLVDPADLDAALRCLHRVLRTGGLLLASVRDYDAILKARPSGEAPRMTGAFGHRRVTAQVWEWDAGQPTYRVHQFVIRELPDGAWSARHYEARYRAFQRSELMAASVAAGFHDVRWLEPAETGYYQPIVTAQG